MKTQVIQDFKTRVNDLEQYLSDANMSTILNWLDGDEVREDVLLAILKIASRNALKTSLRAKHVSQMAAELALWIGDESNE